VDVARLGGQTETIVDGVTGFLFPSGDAAALASAISHAFALTPDQRSAMAVASRRSVIDNNYTVDAMCAATLEVYRQLVSARQDTN
jgi:glycosyltransferase involved in cell wall biosynthesis